MKASEKPLFENPISVKGRVAVVVGGTSGIGRVLALGLAAAGANVVPAGRRVKMLSEVCAEVESYGRRTMCCPMDVLDRKSVDNLRDEVLKELGHVDILINAAGQTVRKPTREISESEWHRLFDINVTGMLRACQSFYEPLAASGHGRIINIASLSSFVGLMEVAAYSASKAAVLSLTRSLGLEWAKNGINVNAIAPGVFRTDLNSKLLDGTDRGREFLLRTPMGRFGNSHELIGVALLLASDAASFITGECIVVDGGFLASGVNS